MASYSDSAADRIKFSPRLCMAITGSRPDWDSRKTRTALIPLELTLSEGIILTSTSATSYASDPAATGATRRLRGFGMSVSATIGRPRATMSGVASPVTQNKEEL